MEYIRINIIAEGQTEMEFSKNVLNKFFIPQGIIVDSRCVQTAKSKLKTFRGGLLNYEKAKADIWRWIKEEKNSEPYFSTMFDLYALPHDFPNFEASLKIADPYDRVAFLEKSLKEDIGYYKFIPYIQLHEFEALLLANPDSLLLEYPDKANEIAQLKQIVVDHDNNPEKVNTGEETAPSKRIIKLIPAYKGNKVTVGAYLPSIDDLQAAQQNCKHFSEWINQIMQLNP
jgi:hypothetical protein